MASSAHRARLRAVRHLLRVEDEGARATRLDAFDQEAPDEAATARLASDLVAGVTRHRRWLDFLIAHFYRGDAATLDPELRQVLRIGLYDLLVRETPPHAAVNEATEAAKALLHRGAGSLTNGLLRAAVRARDGKGLPEPEADTEHTEAEALAIRHSHPTWLVQRWLARFGPEETERLLQASNRPPRFGLRVNTLKTTPEALTERLGELHVAMQPSAFLDDFLVVERLQPILRADLLDEGLCAVQDEAAGLVVRVLDPQPGETILDAAAAPGGKTLYAAQRMQNAGRIVALDIHEGKTDLVRRAAEQYGVSIVEAVAGDLRTVSFQAGAESQFDRVLLDAPCSGLGVLGKRADLRWNREEEAIGELAALQDDLLDAAARHVRPGGLLVYSTCTIAPEENAARIAAFLDRQAAFSLEPVGPAVPQAMQTPEGFYEALPHRHGTDGAFAARLRRAA